VKSADPMPDYTTDAAAAAPEPDARSIRVIGRSSRCERASGHSRKPSEWWAVDRPSARLGAPAASAPPGSLVPPPSTPEAAGDLAFGVAAPARVPGPALDRGRCGAPAWSRSRSRQPLPRAWPARIANTLAEAFVTPKTLGVFGGECEAATPNGVPRAAAAVGRPGRGWKRCRAAAERVRVGQGHQSA
jgi:hypothetical protein